MDTISAIATPLGQGGIGIVRLSGPEALAVADKIFISHSEKSVLSQKNFTARYGRVFFHEDPQKKVLDEALLLVMRAPRSYTGEDVVEIQTHGGPAVLRAVLDLTIRAGARSAQPGEFTKRAFLNGRLDLLQAEAVLDLIQAKTDRAVRWAASQLEGHLSKTTAALKGKLLELLAHLEASVDFPEDFPETKSLKQAEESLASVQSALSHLLKSSALGLLAKQGLKIVLWGRPNVGKSSILNRLTRTDRVIVTPVPGTTRDVVEEEILIGDFAARLQDTAGMQETENPIEKESVKRSRQAVANADLVLFILDGSRRLDPNDKKLWEWLSGKPTITVLNKSDLPQKLGMPQLKRLPGVSAVVSCSCVKEEGDRDLRQEILRFMTQGVTEMSDEPLVTSARQKEHLEKALADVEQARQACATRLSSEFIASDVRRAMDHLGELTGEVVTDDVLELLFSKFCIGK